MDLVLGASLGLATAWAARFRSKRTETQQPKSMGRILLTNVNNSCGLLPAVMDNSHGMLPAWAVWDPKLASEEVEWVPDALEDRRPDEWYRAHHGRWAWYDSDRPWTGQL